MYIFVANLHILCAVSTYVQLFVSTKTRFGWQGRDHQQSNDGNTRAAQEQLQITPCHPKYPNTISQISSSQSYIFNSYPLHDLLCKSKYLIDNVFHSMYYCKSLLCSMFNEQPCTRFTRLLLLLLFVVTMPKIAFMPIYIDFEHWCGIFSESPG